MYHRGISLSDAQDIVGKAISIAFNKKSSPLSIALLDSGGHLKVFVSEDGT